MECSIEENNQDDQEILNRCVDLENITSITIDKIIGKGSYGVVYSGKINNSARIAIKKIIFKKNKLKNIQEEIAFAKELSNKNIAPEFITAFYRSVSPEENIAYIIMERMNGDCYSYLNSRENDLQHKIYIINYMIFLIGDLLDNTDLICTDIKSNNFLYKIIDFDKDKIEVKMSDFGEFCFKEISDNFYEKIINYLKKKNTVKEFRKELANDYITIIIYYINVCTLLSDISLIFINNLNQFKIVLEHLDLEQFNNFKPQFYEIFDSEDFYDTPEFVPFNYYASKNHNEKKLLKELKKSNSNSAFYTLLEKKPLFSLFKKKSLRKSF